MIVNEAGFIALLKEKGLKVTNQRLYVLEAIASCEGKHLSTEEIYDLVREKHPEIGLATVYRSIQLLLELEIIDKITFDDGFVRYELHCEPDEKHHHHHLICRSCGKVYTFEEDLLDTLENKIQQKLGFQVVNHEVKLYGYCKECQDNSSNVEDKKEISNKSK